MVFMYLAFSSKADKMLYITFSVHTGKHLGSRKNVMTMPRALRL